jgi:hypothetical protein
MTAARTRRSGSKVTGLMLLMVVIVLGMTFMPTTLLVVVGLVPTFVAFVVDQSEKRSITLTVGFLNAAGIVPSAIDLWQHGQTLDHSIALIENPLTCFMAYGAAAGGWLVKYSVPPVAQFLLAQSVKADIADLEKYQSELRRVWGDEVKAPPSSPAMPRS